jgi:hypothetical protein
VWTFARCTIGRWLGLVDHGCRARGAHRCKAAVANRKKDRRSRKRRPSTAATAAGAVVEESEPRKRKARGADGAAAHPERPGAKKAKSATAPEIGEDGRPLPPWHPLPLAEIFILAGAIAFAIGLNRGITHGRGPLLVGVAVAMIGTVEFAWREHRGGFRSHTVLLTLIPVIFFHSAVVLGISAFTRFPPLANIGLIALDIALIAFLFRMLRARFIDGHRTRVFEGRRSRR